MKIPFLTVFIQKKKNKELIENVIRLSMREATILRLKRMVEQKNG